MAPGSLGEGPKGPIPPAGTALAVSLSHTHGLTGVALSTVPVGLDLEAVDSGRDPVALAARVFPAAEASHVAAGAARERFLELWCVREAAFKAGFLPCVGAGPALIRDGRITAPFPFLVKRLQAHWLALVSGQPGEATLCSLLRLEGVHGACKPTSTLPVRRQAARRR